MNHCRKWEVQIPLYVLSELDAAHADALCGHMADCERCRLLCDEMSRKEPLIVAGFETLAAAGRGVDANLLEQAARGGFKTDDSANPDHALVRRISKVAAAIVIVAALIGLCVLAVNTGGSAFAEIVRPIRESRTCTFSTKVTNSAADLAQGGRGMFSAPGRMRVEGEGDVIMIADFEQCKMLMLMADKKMAMLTEFENMSAQELEKMRCGSFFGLREMIASAGDSAEYLGERQIDGIKAVGYRLDESLVETQVWADAATLLPILIETRVAGMETSTIMSDFVFDVELDKSLFSLQVPEGYESAVMQMDASMPQEQELIEVLRSCAEKNDGKFPPELTALSLVRATRPQQSLPPFELTNEQEAELRDELSLILADVKANLLQLEDIAKGRRQPENLDMLKDEIDDDLRRLEEFKQKKQSLEDEVRQTRDKWRNSQNTNLLHIMRDAYKEGWPAGRALAFLQMLGPDSDWCYAGNGVKLGQADKPIFRYKPKDSDKYRVLYADLTIKEVTAGNLPEMPQTPQPPPPLKMAFDANSFSTARQISEEQEFIWSLGVFTDFCDGNFPSSVGHNIVLEFHDYQSRRKSSLSSNTQVGPLCIQVEMLVTKISHIFIEGALFAFCLDVENDFCYAGRGVTRDDTNTPIFWYKSDGSELYRVIYSDFSVETVARENLPQPPDGAETYEDLHKELQPRADAP